VQQVRSFGPWFGIIIIATIRPPDLDVRVAEPSQGLERISDYQKKGTVIISLHIIPTRNDTVEGSVVRHSSTEQEPSLPVITPCALRHC
jgi:hypothetical protein